MTESFNRDPKVYLSKLEFDILRELNKAREHPQDFAKEMEVMRSRYKGNEYHPNGRVIIMTHEGVTAFTEAVNFLKQQAPIGPLAPSYGLTLAAQDHVADQSQTGQTGHDGSDGSDSTERIQRYGRWLQTCGENIGYGSIDPFDIVVQLIIDDGVPNRGHRKNIFTLGFHVVGIACGSHAAIRSVCVMDFAGGYQDDMTKIAKRLEARQQAYERSRQKKFDTEHDQTAEIVETTRPAIHWGLGGLKPKREDNFLHFEDHGQEEIKYQCLLCSIQ
eukprot:TRINITY_DN4334_c0_g1_i2.p1 TRINITY_DN4334_c0_g1~~TRINITY_DN4334_c0_g1_i2.p1  ORF type:complete len:274 (+),score=44.82 TRINITY_DN4334_c0_g1_i2:165-986(+)